MCSQNSLFDLFQFPLMSHTLADQRSSTGAVVSLGDILLTPLLTWKTRTCPSWPGKLLPFDPDAIHHVEHSDHKEHKLWTFRILLRRSLFPSGVKYCQKLFSPAPPEHFQQVVKKSLTVPGTKRYVLSSLR